MKCLITGASGFIGNALMIRLHSEQYNLRGLIHKNLPDKKLENVSYYYGDITDIESIRSAVKGVDVIFHCAAHMKDFGSKKKFYNINFEGTKNLVLLSREFGIKKFIYVSHMDYENVHKMGFYSDSKKLAEEYLIDQYKREKFPCVIIQPGNVYGPGKAVWVLFLLNAINKNRIALIDNGDGIFLHTYIDNLIDALLKSMKSDKAVGEIIQITDGDNDTRWRDYLNSLSEMIGKQKINRNISKKRALIISKTNNYFSRIFNTRIIISSTAVHIMTNKKKVSINKAKEILNYNPQVNYKKGMKNIKKWLMEEGYIIK
jgi:nucleoside-diphosphate-sugar epimerase